jgi:hypothetical protein
MSTTRACAMRCRRGRRGAGRTQPADLHAAGPAGGAAGAQSAAPVGLCGRGHGHGAGALPVPHGGAPGLDVADVGALGQELDIYYRQLCADLREQGVGAMRPVRVAAAPMPAAARRPGAADVGAPAHAAGAMPPRTDALDRSDQYHCRSEHRRRWTASDLPRRQHSHRIQAHGAGRVRGPRDMNQVGRWRGACRARPCGGPARRRAELRAARLRASAHGLEQSLGWRSSR